MISDLPDTWLNNGNIAHATNTAITVAVSVTITDSARNWAIKYLLLEPNTLRTPTSRARLAERAVERFMKLMQASINIKTAITENIYTYSTLPLIPSSRCRLEWR